MPKVKSPKVSVVIPAYNHEKYVAEAIQSVLDQSFQDFEIVITDDASTDGTLSEIKKFDDPRIRLFELKKNCGGSVAANKCIKHTKGEYVAVLSSDDVFLPGKLEKQVKFLDENKKVAAVFGFAEIIDERGGKFDNGDHFYSTVFKQENRSRFEWLRKFFYDGNCLCHPSMLIRREIYDDVGLYDPRFAQLPDFDMWIRICMKYEIFVMQENLINFRVRDGEMNASGNRAGVGPRTLVEFLEVLKNYLKIGFFEDFSIIFPGIFGDLDQVDDDLIPFLVAKLAIDMDISFGVKYKHFAIGVLVDLLKDQELAEKLEKVFGFTYSDLIDVTGSYEMISSQNLFAQLFIDTGGGFSPEQSLIQSISGRERCIEFDLRGREEIKGVRFDPVNDFAIIRIDRIEVVDDKGGVHVVKNYKSNSYYEEYDRLIFATDDPQIYNIDFSGMGVPSKIIVKLEFMVIGFRTLDYVLKYVDEKIHSKDSEINELTLRRLELEKEIDVKLEIVAEKDKNIRDLNEVVAVKDDEIKDLNEVVAVKKECVKEMESTIEQIDEEIDNLNAVVERSGEEVHNLNRIIRSRDNAIVDLRKSWSFRIGRIFTYPLSPVYKIFNRSRK